MWKVDVSKIVTAEQKAEEARAALQAQFSAAIQAHLDTEARARRYDGIQAAITYRGDPNPQFAAEAEAFFAWRSAVWSHAAAELAKVNAGERPQPSIEEFIAELPPIIPPS
ncbi:hypothetical protein GOB44_21655 [Sinorhizobium meliloti]|nr:hypothetical protein [Sinorhizobium meliloti]MDW9749799.1 hypothetical protein [Sinorhizobium meliloti]